MPIEKPPLDSRPGAGRRSRGRKGWLPPPVRKRLLIEILDSARTGRLVGSIAKDFEISRETVRGHILALKNIGYDIRNPTWADSPDDIVASLHIPQVRKYTSMLAGAPNLVRSAAAHITGPPPPKREEGIQHAPRLLPKLNPDGLLTLEDRRQLLSAIAGAANLPPQARVAAVKLLDDIELTHRPAETYAPSPPLTSEERLARLRRILSCFSQEEIQTAIAS